MSQIDELIKRDDIHCNIEDNIANDTQYIEDVNNFIKSLGYSSVNKIPKSIWSKLRKNKHYKLARVLDNKLHIVDFISDKNNQINKTNMESVIKKYKYSLDDY